METYKKYLTEKFGKNYTEQDMASEMFNEIKKSSDKIIDKYKKQMKNDFTSSKIPMVFKELSKQQMAYWKGIGS